MTRLSHPPTVPYVANERAMLTAFLDAMRLAVRAKLDGLSDEQARSVPTASGLSLLGIVKHLAWTESRWFRSSFADEDVDDPRMRGDNVAEFSIDPSETIESVLRFYDEECERARELTATATSLDELAANRRFSNEVSLRWILVHMIEETARHAGHADVIRETLDGSVGE
jgi:uncharacterized damage-inducible protein DinB